jgi:hypothetical protein
MTNPYEQAAKYLDTQLVEPVRQSLIGRKLYAKTVVLGDGVFNVDYNKISDMGEAIIQYDLPDDSIEKDSVKIETSTLKLAVIPKGYKIPMSQFQAFQRTGVGLDTAAMISAAQKCGEKEDDLLIQGWAPDGSTYKISGLYQSAGNTDATSCDWATFGNPTKSVAAALALLYADEIKGVNFNLTLNYVQYAQLQANYEYGVYEWDKVMKMLNNVPGGGQGQILMSTDITAGTGMMSPVDTAGVYMDLVIGTDYRNALAVQKFPISPIEGITYVVLTPRVKHANAVCTMTGI